MQPLHHLETPRIALGALLSLATLCVACDGAATGEATAGDTTGGRAPASAEASDDADDGRDAERARQAKLDAEFPKHGAVAGVELRVHAKPSAASPVVGWLRIGTPVRLGEEKVRGEGCGGPFRRVHPAGFVCDDALLQVGDAPIETEHPTDEGWKSGQLEQAKARGALVVPPGARDAPLPYDYYFVKEPAVPEYHRLPSRNEQRAALAKAERYVELLTKEDKRAAAYLAGEAQLGPPGTAITARYLDRGFFVASSGEEVRAKRRFVRTTQGRYIKKAQLETRTGHDFEGVELGEGRALPIAWVNRTARMLVGVEKAEGGLGFESDEASEPLERQAVLPNWKGRDNLSGKVMHILETPAGPRYLRAWFVSVAKATKRPPEVPAGGSWVHVDLSEQTLVLYEGETPVFATLVSTGVEDNATPVGVFEIARKRTTATMANLGPEADDDRYRIEDVPWVQYFEGSFALHTAFWHTRFGMARSHGCVNMAPHDAHRVFGATKPDVPDGWHGVSTVDTELSGSYVVVTE